MICICKGGYTLIYKQYHRTPCLLRSQPFVSCCLCFMRLKPKSVHLTFDISHPNTIQFFFFLHKEPGVLSTLISHFFSLIDHAFCYHQALFAFALLYNIMARNIEKWFLGGDPCLRLTPFSSSSRISIC
jgi:hypothetical protein